MANHALPTLTSTYTNFLAEVGSRIDDSMRQGRSDTVTLTNPPVGTIRWNASSSKWQANTGTAAVPVWSDLASSYSINITGTISTPNNAAGVFIGDESRLADRNVANTMFVEGVQNTDRGYINFSVNPGNDLGAVNGGDLTWRGNSVLTSANYNTYAPTNTGTGASGTWAINISGTAAGLSATLAIASGGTGATTAAAALVNMGERTGENGSTKLPTGTTAQRDGTPAAGYIRFNSDITKFEGYTGSAWASIADEAAVVTLTGDQTIAGTKTFSSSPVVPGLNGGQLAGMRNKIINGKMEIAQRGTSFAAIADSAYSLDRWRAAYVSSTVTTISQQADAPTSNEFQNSLRTAVTTADASIATGDYYALTQRVEGFNVRDLIGRTFTLSFWVRSSKTGTHCIVFNNQGFDRSYVAEYIINGANTWEFKTIKVSGGLITAGTWNWTNGFGLSVGFTLACGSTYHTTANAWQTGNLLATTNQVNCLDTVGNIFAITGVQLEAGSVATPFEHRPYGAELALCQRYYLRFRAELSAGSSVSGSGYGGTFPFKVEMRAAPSMLLVSGTGTQSGFPAGTPNTVSSTTGSVWVYKTANASIGNASWAATLETSGAEL